MSRSYFSLSLLQLLLQFISVHFQHLVGFLESVDALHPLQLFLLLGQGLGCQLRAQTRQNDQNGSNNLQFSASFTTDNHSK